MTPLFSGSGLPSFRLQATLSPFLNRNRVGCSSIVTVSIFVALLKRSPRAEAYDVRLLTTAAIALLGPVDVTLIRLDSSAVARSASLRSVVARDRISSSDTEPNLLLRSNSPRLIIGTIRGAP